MLRARYLLESRLTSAGSTSGIVAERARLGLATRPEGGYQGGGGDTVRQELGWLLGLCRGLNEQEERVCRARYAAPAGSVGYERLVRVSDMVEGDGEDIIDVRPKDLDGKPQDGWVLVRGVKSRLPSYQEVAAHLAEQGMSNADGAPMTAGAVEKVLRVASEKIAVSIRARQAMAALEDRAIG